MSFQSVTINGLLGNDPEIRTTGSGTAVTNFRVAVDGRKDKETGERATEWFSVVAFGKRAEIIAEHFSKGKGIIVLGKLQTRKWVDKEGGDRTTTELVVDDFGFASAGRDDRQEQEQDDEPAPRRQTAKPASKPTQRPQQRPATRRAATTDDGEEGTPWSE